MKKVVLALYERAVVAELMKQQSLDVIAAVPSSEGILPAVQEGAPDVVVWSPFLPGMIDPSLVLQDLTTLDHAPQIVLLAGDLAQNNILIRKAVNGCVYDIVFTPAQEHDRLGCLVREIIDRIQRPRNRKQIFVELGLSSSIKMHSIEEAVDEEVLHETLEVEMEYVAEPTLSAADEEVLHEALEEEMEYAAEPTFSVNDEEVLRKAQEDEREYAAEPTLSAEDEEVLHETPVEELEYTAHEDVLYDAPEAELAAMHSAEQAAEPERQAAETFEPEAQQTSRWDASLDDLQADLEGGNATDKPYVVGVISPASVGATFVAANVAAAAALEEFETALIDFGYKRSLHEWLGRDAQNASFLDLFEAEELFGERTDVQGLYAFTSTWEEQNLLQGSAAWMRTVEALPYSIVVLDFSSGQGWQTGELMRALSRCDEVLFVTDIDDAMTGQSLSLLEEMADHVRASSLQLVLNKWESTHLPREMADIIPLTPAYWIPDLTEQHQIHAQEQPFVALQPEIRNCFLLKDLRIPAMS